MSELSLSQEFEKEIKEQLQPLFTQLRPSSPTYKMYQKITGKLNEKIDRANDFIQTLSETTKTLHANPKATSVMYAMVYLSEVELAGSAWVDLAILLLSSLGRDLHLQPDRKHPYTRHVTSLEDLEEAALPLSIKLDFLDSNGLTFFSKWIDRDLRNKIAHLNFEVDKNGKFFKLSRRAKKEVDLVPKVRAFARYSNIVRDTIQAQLGKTVRPKA